MLVPVAVVVAVVGAVVGPVVGPVVVGVGQGVLLLRLLRLLRLLQEAGRESGPFLAWIPLTRMTNWWSSQILMMRLL